MVKRRTEDKNKIKELEKRIEELEQEEKPKSSIVGNALNSLIPGFGKLVSKLSKESPELQKRIEGADKEIKFRLQRGGSARPQIEYHFSSRPLFAGEIPKKGEDISIVVWEETPPVEEGELKVYAIGRKLVIETKDRKFRREIPLKFFVKDIETKYEKGKEKGALMVKMKKRW